MRMRILSTTCFAVAVLSGCQSTPRSSATVEPTPRLFDGMGPHTRKVTTNSPQAQAYFNQGLTWAYAFNHDEAIRSFTEAARLDPNCAMAWWGVALCHGPHINNPVVPPQRATAAWAALQKAIALQAQATPAERALILALAKRYSADPNAPRPPLDAAYANAMAAVWQANPKDADIGALYAESLMDLHPWDLWTKDGQPKGKATEIVAVLEEVQRIDPNHPGALHLYIHAVEASPQPQRAVVAADKLRNLVPAAGHLVHMPSHIDVRVGRWDQAADANARAIEVDTAYRKLVPKQDFYRVYMAHNDHFLAYAAMMEGRYQTALAAARAMIAGVPPDYLAANPAFIDPYAAIEYEVLMRFGKWDELLALPGPPSKLPITTALWHFCRGSAFAAKGQIGPAEREQAEFRAAVGRVPKEAMMAINPAHDVLAIAELVLAGEIDYRRGKIDAAVTLLRDAAAREDKLIYMEPPEWIQPVRHSLGAILLASGRTSDAEAVYRDDLARWPENGWALFGLSECLRKRGATAEAEATEARFQKAWKRADTKIQASCLCVKKEG